MTQKALSKPGGAAGKARQKDKHSKKQRQGVTKKKGGASGTPKKLKKLTSAFTHKIEQIMVQRHTSDNKKLSVLKEDPNAFRDSKRFKKKKK